MITFVFVNKMGGNRENKQVYSWQAPPPPRSGGGVAPPRKTAHAYISHQIALEFLILLVIKVKPVSLNIRHETEPPQSWSAPQEKQETPDSGGPLQVLPAQTRSKTFQKPMFLLQSSRVVHKVHK